MSGRVQRSKGGHSTEEERATGASLILELKVSRLSKKSTRRGIWIEGVTVGGSAGAGYPGLRKWGYGRALSEKEEDGPRGHVSPKGKSQISVGQVEWAGQQNWVLRQVSPRQCSGWGWSRGHPKVALRPSFRKVKPAEAETAGAIMAFFLCLGLALGAVVSFLFRAIV